MIFGVLKAIGDKPADWLAVSQKQPTTIARSLMTNLHHLAKVMPLSFPNLAQAQAGFIKDAFWNTGLTQVDAWYSGRVRTRNQCPLAIHWPSFIVRAPLFFSTPEYIGIALFYLWLLPVFRAKSVTMFELLQRKALEGFSWHSTDREQPIDSLSIAEESLLQGMLNGVARSPVFIKALDEVLRGSFTPVLCAPRTSVQYQKIVERPWERTNSVDPAEFTVLYSVPALNVTNIRRLLPPKINLDALKQYPDVFNSGDISGLAYELFYARDIHLPPNDPQSAMLYDQNGVKRYVFENDNVREVFRVIDLRKFLPGRIFRNVKNYYSITGVDERKNRSFFGSEIFIYEAASRIRARYPSLAEYKGWLERFRLIGSTSNYIYSNDDAPYLLVVGNKWYSFVLECSTVPRNVNAASKKRKPRTPHCLIENVKTASGLVHTIKYAYHYGKIVTTYPYFVNTDELYRMTRRFKGSAPEKALVDGVYQFPSGEFFYTYEFLAKSPSAALTTHPEVQKVIYTLAGTSHMDFKSRFKQTLVKGKGLLFTWDEDEAIKKYYHPNPDPADWTELLRICSRRSSVAISRRAAALRSEMIKDGVFDLKRLPHLNYNIHIQEEIENEQKMRGLI